MTRANSVVMPGLGNELKPDDAKEFNGFFSTLMEYLKNPEPNTLGAPYTTAAPVLTRNGQVAVNGNFIYFRSGNTTYKVAGTT